MMSNQQPIEWNSMELVLFSSWSPERDSVDVHFIPTWPSFCDTQKTLLKGNEPCCLTHITTKIRFSFELIS